VPDPRGRECLDPPITIRVVGDARDELDASTGSSGSAGDGLSRAVPGLAHDDDHAGSLACRPPSG